MVTLLANDGYPTGECSVTLLANDGYPTGEWKTSEFILVSLPVVQTIEIKKVIEMAKNTLYTSKSIKVREMANHEKE